MDSQSKQNEFDEKNEDEAGQEPAVHTKRLDTVIPTLFFALLSIAAFYLMEAYEHNPFAEVRTQAQLFNILLFELIAWLLYFLIGRMRTAIRIELVLAMIFGIVNHYVMLFRSTPFVPWDIYSIGTAASVADGYDFTPDARTVIVTLGFAALIAATHFLFPFTPRSRTLLRGQGRKCRVCKHPVHREAILNDRMPLQFTPKDEKSGRSGCSVNCNHFLKEAPRIRLRFRIPSFFAVLVLLCVFTGALQDEDFQTNHYLYPYLFTPAYMTKVNGMAVTFAMNLQYMSVEKPQGYDTAEAEALLEQYEETEDTGDVDAENYPNIIVIMDEAFSDLAVLGDFETNTDYMPFLHEMQQGAENTVTGYVQVSVCGGNTANSEFEFLTGDTMAFLPSGSIPYQQYIKTQTSSLASWLSGLGYQTYAQHPYYASGWDRESVYPLLGFKYMDFMDDYADKSYVRKYVSDSSDMQHIIDTYNQKEDGSPVFIFNVTMQNHGGYTETYDDFSSDVTANLGSDALDQYLSLIKLTDENLQKLVEYFSDVDEKTMIVFFGDHQPSDSVVSAIWRANGVDSSNLTQEQQLARYQVPYLIWANYDIPEATGQDTSLNYLGAQVLALAGVETSAYQNYLLKLQETYPVISAAGQTISEEAQSKSDAELEEILQEYKILQYYNLFDE